MPGDLFEILSGDSDYTSVSHSDSEKTLPGKNHHYCHLLFPLSVASPDLIYRLQHLSEVNQDFQELNLWSATFNISRMKENNKRRSAFFSASQSLLVFRYCWSLQKKKSLPS